MSCGAGQVAPSGADPLDSILSKFTGFWKSASSIQVSATPPKVGAPFQLMFSKIENIGRYMAMTMPPMMAPMNAIMSGSIRAVSCSAVACTSSS